MVLRTIHRDGTPGTSIKKKTWLRTKLRGGRWLQLNTVPILIKAKPNAMICIKW
jgi:hypothetical protein